MLSRTLVTLIALLGAMGAIGEEAKRVKVFVLAGQSNMVGHGKVEMGKNPEYKDGDKGVRSEVKGGIGCLRTLATDPKTKATFGHHLDEDGNWVVRDDVFITCNLNDRFEKGKLTPGFGKGPWFGPELEFGHVVGDFLDEPVLIIKAAWGGKDLAVDFRPPSSGPRADNGNREVGAYYRKVLAFVEASLTNLASDFPELAGYKPELAGFGWHQGYNDGVNNEATAEYEANLVNLIKDLRRDFGVENLPFVVGNTGLNGFAEGNFQRLCEAQLRVGDDRTYPEFAGNVKSVDTRPFKRSRAVSPSHMGHHWYHNAEPHFLVGQAMGNAMVELLKK